MAETTNFNVYQGTAPRLRFTLIVPEDVATWTTRFYIRENKGDANSVFEAAGSIATTPVNAADIGVFAVPMTAADTSALALRVYVWSFERTNLGFEDVLALGSLAIKTK